MGEIVSRVHTYKEVRDTCSLRRRSLYEMKKHKLVLYLVSHYDQRYCQPLHPQHWVGSSSDQNSPSEKNYDFVLQFHKEKKEKKKRIHKTISHAT